MTVLPSAPSVSSIFAGILCCYCLCQRTLEFVSPRSAMLSPAQATRLPRNIEQSCYFVCVCGCTGSGINSPSEVSRGQFTSESSFLDNESTSLTNTKPNLVYVPTTSLSDIEALIARCRVADADAAQSITVKPPVCQRYTQTP